MKRALKIIGLLFVVFVLAIVGLLAATFMGRQSITDGAEASGIRIVKDGIVSVAIIPVSEREIALVDAGNDKSAKAILAELSRRHLGPDAVTTILLTHGHPDHTGGVPMFPKAQVISGGRPFSCADFQDSFKIDLPVKSAISERDTVRPQPESALRIPDPRSVP